MAKAFAASEGSGAAAADASFGERILALADRLALHSETPDGLTCTFLSPAHRAVAAELAALMKTAGLDVTTDAAANVVGRYRSRRSSGQSVVVASHYDTVRNAGRYDGRLGILAGLLAAKRLVHDNADLPFDLELIAFSEEEGARFATPYIGSAAVAGRFNRSWLDRRDRDGTAMHEAMREAGYDPGLIADVARPRGQVAAYLEVHIEQGPVLLKENLPVGIVTDIAGNSRYLLEIEGEAGHAGTVPMGLRHDAVAAAAEVILLLERRCSAPGLLGTAGTVTVPHGAINLIPGRCTLSLDIRSGSDDARKAAVADIHAAIAEIARRRGVTIAMKEVLDEPAVPCSASLQDALAAAVTRAGLPVRRLPSGAGHDAVMFSGLTEIGMLFVRCGNGGVSHSPLETINAGDADVATRVLLDFLLNFKPG